MDVTQLLLLWGEPTVRGLLEARLRAVGFQGPNVDGDNAEQVLKLLGAEFCALLVAQLLLQSYNGLVLQQIGAQLLHQAALHGDVRAPSVRIGRIELDVPRRRVAVDGRAVRLSSAEFDLLRYLADRPHQVITAEQLARALLPYPCSPAEARELFKVRIHRLRHKIEPNPRNPALLLSVRGVGYMLAADDEAGSSRAVGTCG